VQAGQTAACRDKPISLRRLHPRRRIKEKALAQNALRLSLLIV
jgi:hypothetical protein